MVAGLKRLANNQVCFENTIFTCGWCILKFYAIQIENVKELFKMLRRHLSWAKLESPKKAVSGLLEGSGQVDKVGIQERGRRGEGGGEQDREDEGWPGETLLPV